MEKETIYSSMHKQYKKQLIALEKSQISPAKKELILGYINNLFAKGNGEGTATKRLNILKRVLALTPKEIIDLNIQDLQNITANINRQITSSRYGHRNEPLAEATKADFRKELRRFLDWYENFDPLLKSDEYRVREDRVSFYKYAKKNLLAAYKKSSLDYSSTLNDEDYAKLSPACNNIKERAIIATLYFTGVRSTELLMMRIKDVEIKGDYAMIRVDGKTGERRVPILEALPAIQQHLRDHPLRHDPNARLWLGDNRSHNLMPLRHGGLTAMLFRIFKRAGINKKDNPHWFRHSRATIWAPQYSETILCKLMGWKVGSAQVQTYVHLGASQVENAFLEQNNLANASKKELAIISCSICNTKNSPTEQYCHNCLRPLSLKTVLDSETLRDQATNQALRRFMELMKNPDEMKRFMEMK